MFQFESAIAGAISVEQERKARSCFGLPRAGLIALPKRNQSDARVRRLKFCRVLTQLCHVLAARQSTQMSQKDQQGILSLAQHLGEGDALSINRRQRYVGRSEVGWQIHFSYLNERRDVAHGANVSTFSQFLEDYAWENR